MITRLLGQFFSVRHQYDNPLLQQRAQRLIWLIWATIGTLVLVLILRLVASSLQQIRDRDR